MLIKNYQLIFSGGEQPLTEDELRILTIVLAEHSTRLSNNSLNLEAAISGQQEIHKHEVVKCLRKINQDEIAKILNNKQGRNNLT